MKNILHYVSLLIQSMQLKITLVMIYQMRESEFGQSISKYYRQGQ